MSTPATVPSLLPFRVASDEMLCGREPSESKLSRESSLLCPPPPPPSLRWWISRSEYQLSPKPLSLMLLSVWSFDSCRAFSEKHKPAVTHLDNRVPAIPFTYSVWWFSHVEWEVPYMISGPSYWTVIINILLWVIQWTVKSTLNNLIMFSFPSSQSNKQSLDPYTLLMTALTMRKDCQAHKSIREPLWASQNVSATLKRKRFSDL